MSRTPCHSQDTDVDEYRKHLMAKTELAAVCCCIDHSPDDATARPDMRRRFRSVSITDSKMDLSIFAENSKTVSCLQTSQHTPRLFLWPLPCIIMWPSIEAALSVCTLSAVCPSFPCIRFSRNGKAVEISNSVETALDKSN